MSFNWLNAKGKVNLDIGCDYHKLKGFIGIDIEKANGVDVVADFHHLPFAESSVDLVHTRHTLEHVEKPHKCFEELFRICKSKGYIVIIVPHYSNPAYWGDMTHLRPFSVRAFEYYDLEFAKQAGFPIYLKNINLKTISARLVWWPKRIISEKSLLKRGILTILNGMIEPLANFRPILGERFLSAWVGGFYEVEFVLQPVKQNG